MKISIIGHGGGGKSTLTRRISSHFKIPHLELDRLWFCHGGHDLFLRGNVTDKERKEVREKIKQDVESFMLQHNDWVIDGTYTKVQSAIADAADSIVYIKRPLYKRLYSHLFRIVKNEHRHPETTKLQDVLFSLQIVKRWSKGEYRKVEMFVEAYEDKLVRLRSFKEINAYFNSLLK